MKRVVLVKVQTLICVGFLVVHLEFSRTIVQTLEVYILDRQMLLSIVLTLCLYYELNFGILLVQKLVKLVMLSCLPTSTTSSTYLYQCAISS